MIKRFHFGTLVPPPVGAGPVPVRVVVCHPLDGSEHDGFVEEWFVDGARLPTATGDDVVVARERVKRGALWLAQRWADDGPRWKHVALAQRAEGLTPAEFSARWAAHAGRAATHQADTPVSIPVSIPEAARGCAYAQNHPVPRTAGDGTAGEWRHDAITEVWFESPAAMQVRVDWFRDNLAPDELFRSTRFITVREEVLAVGQP